MYSYSLVMALVDFIPTILFFVAAVTIFEYVKKSKPFPAFIYLIGALMVACAGFLKAGYKLLTALGKGDIEWMTNQFFTNQALGFLICGLGMLCAAISYKKLYSFLPTMAVVGIMVAGLAMTNISLCVIASKAKKKGCIAFFIPAMVLCLMMGYLSTKDFSQSYMNWAAEGINTLAQLFLLLGAKKLSKKAKKA